MPKILHILGCSEEFLGWFVGVVPVKSSTVAVPTQLNFDHPHHELSAIPMAKV